MRRTSSTIPCSTISNGRERASMTSAVSCSTDDRDARNRRGARMEPLGNTRRGEGRNSGMKTTLPRGTILFTLLSGLAVHGAAGAQAAPASEATTPLATGAPLSLLEAVRTTLRMHPAIQTANAELRQRN